MEGFGRTRRTWPGGGSGEAQRRKGPDFKCQRRLVLHSFSLSPGPRRGTFKGKPGATRGRKATGPMRSAGLPT